ncbi:hypothetical protein Krac_7616 [Ktedonobacter racemifer DSM 44963]|uniref:Uncharacterized protein n=1 Tax=Ktedonobacter racemifer DSM 44963 TaxID=485913 RepID=D6TKM3_KTERA|nr:hypothetical protein Krac_7616 [Ktedonobacter racemifer DSM 44963]
MEDKEQTIHDELGSLQPVTRYAICYIFRVYKQKR